MIQVLPTRAPIGQAAGKGLVETLGPMFQRRIAESELQRALSPLAQPGFEQQTYPQQLSQLLPALISSPGGAQLAGELAPILQSRAQNRAYLDYLSKGRTSAIAPEQVQEAYGAKREPELKVQVEGAPGEEKEVYGGRKTSERHLRYPEMEVSPETTYPEQTIANIPQTPFTPQQMQQKVNDLLTQSAMQGKPMDPSTAWGLVNQEQSNLLKHNELIAQDKQRREEAYDKRISQGLARADADRLIDPANLGDRDVFEKFLAQASKAENPNEQYIAAKNKFRTYQHARDQLLRTATIPNIAQKFARKMIGTHKEKEEAIKSIQPQINTFKEFGLLDPLRNILTSQIGLGAEDAETAIFPPSETEKRSWNRIRKNTNIPEEVPGEVFGVSPKNIPFPGEGFEANPEDFDYLKNQIAEQFRLFPETNFVSFRGFLNQKQRWAWQDISRAVDELLDEGSIKLDPVQMDQKHIINNPPAVGMAQYFNYWFKETK